MSKFYAVVIFCFVSIFQSDAFSADYMPGVAKTKDIVRLSLWYEGVPEKAEKSISQSTSKLPVLSAALRSALYKTK